MDWGELFGLSVSPLEWIVRGTAMYLFLFMLFRVVVKRRVGSIGMADILVVVIIADAAQNMLIDWLTYRVPKLQSILEPPPLLLIDNGRVLRRHLRHEFVSETELKTKLREHGVTDPAEVAKAFMEPDGEVTVLKKKP